MITDWGPKRDDMNERVRETLNELREEVSRLETLEPACQGAQGEDRHVSFFAGPFEKSIWAVSRDMIQIIERLVTELDHPAERTS